MDKGCLIRSEKDAKNKLKASVPAVRSKRRSAGVGKREDVFVNCG